MKLPVTVFKLCSCGALLVGSTAERLLTNKRGKVRDWDLIVPYDKWRNIAGLVGEIGAKANLFGGFKLRGVQGESIDVWPMALQEYLTLAINKRGEPPVVVDVIAKRVFTSEIKQLNFN